MGFGIWSKGKLRVTREMGKDLQLHSHSSSEFCKSSYARTWLGLRFGKVDVILLSIG